MCAVLQYCIINTVFLYFIIIIIIIIDLINILYTNAARARTPSHLPGRRGSGRAGEPGNNKKLETWGRTVTVTLTGRVSPTVTERETARAPVTRPAAGGQLSI